MLNRTAVAGIGAALVKQVIVEARALKISAFTVTVHPHNAVAIRLYERGMLWRSLRLRFG
ncbi:MAG: GNAT family N-acetyltransferase [Xanthobacteraceae bacterium]